MEGLLRKGQPFAVAATDIPFSSGCRQKPALQIAGMGAKSMASTQANFDFASLGKIWSRAGI